MTPILVDSNIVLDLTQKDPRWGDWSKAAIQRFAGEAILVINPIVYAEVSIGYREAQDVEAALPVDLYRREPLPYDAAFLAGRAFLAYRRRGGVRSSPMADFYIGAHAVVRGYRLLTRDTRQFRTYFPTIELIAP